MERNILVSDTVQDKLRMVFLDRSDLIRSMEGQEIRPVPESPGTFACAPTLAVPRPLDPETSELRRLDVRLRAVEGGYEVISVDGIDLGALES